MYKLKFNPTDKVPKVKQIVQSVVADIERGVLKNGCQLPSISELSEQYYVARDTVERAYRELRERGFITSVQGKGYYIQSKGEAKCKILLLFNEMSSYKKLVYYAFIEALKGHATVDIQIYHYDAVIFKEIIEKNLGRYNYYVVMPHFALGTNKADYLEALNEIPAEELVLLDKDMPDLHTDCLRVFQDFEKDLYCALQGLNDLLAKYHRLVLILPSDGNYPQEIALGFRCYCIQNNKEFCIKETATDEAPREGTGYVIIRETDLVELVKKIRQSYLLLGRDIGVVTFNETPLKDLLDITVITTEFEEMGRTAATMLLNKQRTRVKNPFTTIRRRSL
ncbi:GntR family transcriptional regulator [Hymenobacter jejuensis]|uniref:GntR family transcriptional regulator n=1 Tax=Hymenobacter jejuensis TaxID=2502781 RepID=A0A5B8A5Y0_9BACT|nr:GntR family transcriptional regulator [Hymenobacter jejuensis]QDA61642.1 GntR family transcriptional regulator [Hymenobacter jejuensis]